ncbi:4-alpha-glucanotransferase, partial [Soehngenia saccharolytica]
KGIEIVGDIPIYVAFDSADTWANSQLFQLDEQKKPIAVAGCPPDAFSATGQLWGNPLYCWEYHRNTGYAWWIRRVEYCCSIYDIVRIDHFRGFDEYWSVPYGDETASGGHWEAGPGVALFREMEKKIGKKQIIAEDLGFLTPSVIQMVKDSGFPGMKVLQFAFDSREASDYMPYN